jgi:hypothetical protein
VLIDVVNVDGYAAASMTFRVSFEVLSLLAQPSIAAEVDEW